MAVYLAIDLGERRTGLAVGDDEVGHVGPIGVIEHAHAPDEPIAGIRRAVEEHAPDALVLGVPYNMDGSVGPAAKRARAFAERLADALGLPVHEVDERLTTFTADEQMKASGLTHRQKRSRRDALAAAAILRDFLHRGG